MTPDSKHFEPIYPTADQVPVELLPLKRWCARVATVYNEVTKKWSKLRHSPFNRQQIGVTPVGLKGQDWESHWTDFATAVAGAKKHRLSGVGFVFVEADGFCGVDLDHRITVETNEMSPAAKLWLDKWLVSYQEIPPSREGVSVFLKARMGKLEDDDLSTAIARWMSRAPAYWKQHIQGQPFTATDLNDLLIRVMIREGTEKELTFLRTQNLSWKGNTLSLANKLSRNLKIYKSRFGLDRRRSMFRHTRGGWEYVFNPTDEQIAYALGLAKCPWSDDALLPAAGTSQAG